MHCASARSGGKREFPSSDFNLDSWITQYCPELGSPQEKKAVCYSIELTQQDIKKKILVIWYEKDKIPRKAVFFDFPFPIIGILSFFMYEKKDSSPVDSINDIKAIAEIMIRDIPGQDTEKLQASYFNIERNAFFSIKTSSNTTSPLSVEKIPLCFGTLGSKAGISKLK